MYNHKQKRINLIYKIQNQEILNLLTNSRRKYKYQNFNKKQILSLLVPKLEKETNNPKKLRITKIMKELNVEYDVGRSFWGLNFNKLDYLLFDIKKAYIKKIKKDHPDKENGNISLATRTNLIWARAKHLFANKGVFLN